MPRRGAAKLQARAGVTLSLVASLGLSACSKAPGGVAVQASAGTAAAPIAGSTQAGAATGAPASGGSAALGAAGGAMTLATGGNASARGGTGGGAGAGGAGGAPLAQAGSGGASAGAGAAAGSGGSSMVATSACSAAAPPGDLFGCKFAFGTNDPGGSLAAYDELQFMSKWVGYEINADASLPRCDGCSWLSMNVAPTSLTPVYYAYFIGYLGHANGFQDGNQNPNGPNLTTDGAALIRKDRDAIIAAYASYAKQSHDMWPEKPLIWLLEGDFVQYTDMSQKQALSYAELGQLSADIACAIKGNMPNALIAINHSTWNSDDVTNTFWGAMKAVPYDLVWTTGVANNQGFFEASATSSGYNHATATYAFVHGLTGRSILVDTSFGLSAMGDSWSNASPATLDARIADGVIAANVTMPPQNYPSTVAALIPMLDATCKL